MYKRCHGAFAPAPHPRIPSQTMIAVGIDKLSAKVAEAEAFERRHGAVKEIISASIRDGRAVAVGKGLHFGKDWNVFPDFLFAYIAHELWTEPEWNRQNGLPEVQQHPAMQWHTAWANAQAVRQVDEKGLAKTKLGGALAYCRLAYDVYLQEHNSELKKRLLERLRDPAQFQGARFEAAVASIMLTADYELAFFSDKGPAGMRPEFIATHRKTGHRLAVEAKSRHRPGVMGYQPTKPRQIPPDCGVQGLIRDALAKSVTEPLLIFIEINMPTLAKDAEALCLELLHDWETIKSEYSVEELPAIGIVFYNDVTVWHVSNDVPEGYNTWCYTLASVSRYKVTAEPLLEAIRKATMQRLDVPQDFEPAS